MGGRVLGWGALAAVTLWSAPAIAQEGRREVGVFLRGGVGGYTGGLNPLLLDGPTWGVAVNIQPLNVLGLEVGYEGSRNELSDVRLPGSPVLTRHGASALLKIAPPFFEEIKPFVGAGLGGSYALVSGQTLGLYENDFMEEVPLAAGVEFNTGALTAGLRATYRLLVDEAFAANAAPGTPNGNLFDASFTLGGRF